MPGTALPSPPATLAVSPTTKISFNTIYNDANEPYNRLYETRAFTGNQNTVPNATSGVVGNPRTGSPNLLLFTNY